MQTLNFSYNWNNKLDNLFFTTIRLSPRFEINEIVEIFCKKKRMNNAQCRGKKVIYMKDLDIFTAALDTGYEVESTKKILETMYAGKDWHTTKIYVYLFMKLGVEKTPTLFNQP